MFRICLSSLSFHIQGIFHFSFYPTCDWSVFQARFGTQLVTLYLSSSAKWLQRHVLLRSRKFIPKNQGTSYGLERASYNCLDFRCWCLTCCSSCYTGMMPGDVDDFQTRRSWRKSNLTRTLYLTHVSSANFQKVLIYSQPNNASRRRKIIHFNYHWTLTFLLDGFFPLLSAANASHFGMNSSLPC